MQTTQSHASSSRPGMASRTGRAVGGAVVATRKRIGAPLPVRRSGVPQRPRPDSALVPHVSRPHVLARERLEKWIPFQSRLPRDAAGNEIALSAEDLARTLRATALGYAESTLASYGTGLMYYHEFCDARDIEEVSRTPVSTELMQTFLSTLIGSFSATVIKNASAGVQAWHRIHGID
jgi:hypothetical protein